MNPYETKIMDETRTALLAALHGLDMAINNKMGVRHRIAELIRYTDTGLPVLGVSLHPSAENVLRRWANTCPTAEGGD